MDTLTFSQASLLAFLACKRRFQLRYLEKLTWPDLPLTSKQKAAIEQGQKFHQLVERQILGFREDVNDLADHQLKLWWQRFEQYFLPMPHGRALPELRLTVPIGSHFLTGRFDLVIVGFEKDQQVFNIYDWKTSHPRTVTDLQEDWQSKLYLAMLAEGGNALNPSGGPLLPSQITLTYWYVTDPQIPRTLHYSQKQHEQNWVEIQSVVDDIESCLNYGEWPLTDNWSHCRSCAFWSFCGRFEAGLPEKSISENEIEYSIDEMLLLEPDSP